MDAPEPPKPLNILCLDGGGVRGLSSLLILRSIMENLKLKCHLKKVPFPCEVFDLICGTSTGGLIAIMLGRLRMSVEESITCYIQASKEVFGNKTSFAWVRRIAGSAMYDASILKKCVEDIVADKEKNPDALLEDPLLGTALCCRTFVVAVTQSFADAPPKRFRSYPTPSRPADRCKIWEAARATTAANTFFAPMTMGSPAQTFIDGRLSGANNPSRLARDEVSEIFPGRPIGCFLSLGTGVPKVIAVKGNLDKIARACVDLVTNCEIVDNDVSRKFRKETPEGETNPYFRFSVNRGLESIALDEWTQLTELTAITDRYLELDDQSTKENDCVKILKLRVMEAKAKEEQAETVALSLV